MQISTSLTLLGLPLLTLTSLWAQSVPFGPATDGIYLLAATPSGRFNASFGAELYRLDSAGKLVLVREIVDTNLTEDERERGVDSGTAATAVNRSASTWSRTTMAPKRQCSISDL